MSFWKEFETAKEKQRRERIVPGTHILKVVELKISEGDEGTKFRSQWELVETDSDIPIGTMMFKTVPFHPFPKEKAEELRAIMAAAANVPFSMMTPDLCRKLLAPKLVDGEHVLDEFDDPVPENPLKGNIVECHAKYKQSDIDKGKEKPWVLTYWRPIAVATEVASVQYSASAPAQKKRRSRKAGNSSELPLDLDSHNTY